MNADDLAKLSEFDVETDTYGAVHCASISTSDIDAALQGLQNGESPQMIIRALFVSMGTKGEERQASRAGGTSDRQFDGAALTEDEVERIADTFYQHHRLYSKVSKDEYLELEPGESYASLFVRVLKYYVEKLKRDWEKLMAPLESDIFGSATRAAWRESVDSNGRLRASIENPYIKTLPPLISHNPVKDTNQLLGSLIERIDAGRPVLFHAAELMAALDTTVRNMQADFARSSIASDRKARTAEWIAIFSVVLTLIGLVVSTAFSAYQASDSSVTNELKKLRAEQEQNRALLSRVLTNAGMVQRSVEVGPVKPKKNPDVFIQSEPSRK